MSQFTKNLELDTVLASGTALSNWRSASTSFDQRRILDASGVVVNTVAARTYIADGIYGISDYYPLTVNGTGILQVDIRNQNNCGDVVVLNSTGAEVLVASPSKLSARKTAVTQARIAASGTYYTYVQLKGRSGTEYRIGIDLQVR
jgi:hypothetical protein